jgi:hypothetical protein
MKNSENKQKSTEPSAYGGGVFKYSKILGGGQNEEEGGRLIKLLTINILFVFGVIWAASLLF